MSAHLIDAYDEGAVCPRTIRSVIQFSF